MPSAPREMPVLRYFDSSASRTAHGYNSASFGDLYSSTRPSSAPRRCGCPRPPPPYGARRVRGLGADLRVGLAGAPPHHGDLDAAGALERRDARAALL